MELVSVVISSLGTFRVHAVQAEWSGVERSGAERSGVERSEADEAE